MRRTRRQDRGRARKLLDKLVAEGRLGAYDRVLLLDILDPGWEDRVVEVLNKADLLGGREMVEREAPGAVIVSALTGEGLDDLRALLDERLAAGLETVQIALPPSDGAGIAWLYQHGEVIAREESEQAVTLTVRISPADRARFAQFRF